MSCDMPDFETLIMDGRISIRRALGAPRTSASAFSPRPEPEKDCQRTFSTILRRGPLRPNKGR